MSPRRILVFLVFVFLARELRATCPVSISASQSDAETAVTVTASVSGACGQGGMSIYIDGAWRAGFTCPTASCSHTFKLPTDCLRTGSHTASATGSCNKLEQSNCVPDTPGTASTSFTVNSSPTIGVSYLGPDVYGHGVLQFDYNFPNTTPTNYQRDVDLYIDGALIDFYIDFWGQPQSGTHTRPWNVTCWRTGTHTIKAVATACGGGDPVYQAQNETTVTVNSTPTVDITAAGPADNGDLTIYAPYEFPNTDSFYLRSAWIYVEDTEIRATSVDTVSGTIAPPPVVNVGCWAPGTYDLTAKVIACQQGADPTYVDEAKTSVTIDPVEVTISFDDSVPGAPEAVVTWNFPPSAPSDRRVRVDWMPSGALIDEFTPPTRTGTKRIPLPACIPDSMEMLRAVATKCSADSDEDTTLVVLPECDLSCSCPVGDAPDPIMGALLPSSPAASGPSCAGDPVRMTNGNMRLGDSDPIAGEVLAPLQRTYDSRRSLAGAFGRGWRSVFDAWVRAAGNMVLIGTADGERVAFSRLRGVYRQVYPGGYRTGGWLASDSAGRYFYNDGRITWTFRGSDGRLIGVRDNAGLHDISIAYDSQGRPQSVADGRGAWAWTVVMGSQGIATISVVGRSDLTWRYGYDGAGNLQTVTSPLGTWRTYTYGAHGLREARNGAGHLLEAHEYDAFGRAITSIGPSGDITAIDYDLTGRVAGEKRTRVTSSSGETTDYYVRQIAGRKRTVEVAGSCGCGGDNAVFAHDADGHVVRQQGADGYITLRTFSEDRVISEQSHLRPSGCDPSTDPAHCRLSPDALATVSLVPTSATLTRTFSYADAMWQGRPTRVETPSVLVAGSSRRDDYAYQGGSGAVASTTVTGWTGTSPAQATRTSVTTLYGAGNSAPAFDPGGTFQSAWLSLPQPVSLPRSTNGPRTDVQDVTDLVYYPVDAAVPSKLRGRLAATKNAAGHITRYEDYDLFGSPTRIVDPNGVATEMAYDLLGRLTSTTIKAVAGCNTAQDPLCATDLTTTRSYLAPAGPVQTEQRAGGGVTAYTYDDRGRVLTLSRGPAVNDLRERMEITYDPATGKKSLERFLSFEAGTWVEKRRESYAYDALGQLETLTHADGSTVAYTYEADGQLATVRDESHTSPNTFYTYDPAGRLATVRQILGASSVTTHYNYDVHGNLASVTDPNGNVTQYVYDDFGQLLTQHSPVTGTTQYAYDQASNLTLSTDANGAATERTYDALGRVLSAESTQGVNTETVTWTYDDPTAGRFSVSRPSSMTDPAGATTYHYERRGLLREEARTFVGNTETYITGFTYDRDGNRSTLRYPSTQLTVNYTFDYAGREVSASGFVTSAAYLPFGPLMSLTLTNGTSQLLAYDTRYRMTANELRLGSIPLARYTYEYDPAGNQIRATDAIDSAYDRTYQYDGLHRLTRADTGTALWGKGAYSWDAMGNLLSYELGFVEQAPEGPVLSLRRGRPQPADDPLGGPRRRSGSFTYVGTTPLVAAATTNDIPRNVTYDAAGNELSYWATRTYSPRNLLARVTDLAEPGEPLVHTLTYAYDGRGVRVIRTESPSNGPGTSARRYYVYTPELSLLSVTRDDTPNVWGLSLRSAPDKNVSYEIVWFAGRPVAQVPPAAPAQYTFTDHLGTPILQTNTTGTITGRVEYEPFGNVYEVREGSRTAQPLRFPGQEVAMTWEGPEERYNVFRWYRAGWGRYTQSDPDLLVRAVSEESQNYGYALNSPIRFIDPLGLYAVAGSCKRCESIDPKSKNLSEYILGETSAWCRVSLGKVTDVRLRDCMREQCRSGRVECIVCTDPGLYGRSDTRGSALGHAIARIRPNRTAYVCLDTEGNYLGEAGNTVVHEWAHGCGCDADIPGRCVGIPGLPTGMPSIPRRRRGRS